MTNVPTLSDKISFHDVGESSIAEGHAPILRHGLLFVSTPMDHATSADTKILRETCQMKTVISKGAGKTNVISSIPKLQDPMFARFSPRRMCLVCAPFVSTYVVIHFSKILSMAFLLGRNCETQDCNLLYRILLMHS